MKGSREKKLKKDTKNITLRGREEDKEEDRRRTTLKDREEEEKRRIPETFR